LFVCCHWLPSKNYLSDGDASLVAPYAEEEMEFWTVARLIIFGEAAGTNQRLWIFLANFMSKIKMRVGAEKFFDRIMLR